MGKKSTLSTGQAATLCSVKPDTVLKWIRANKVSATRTAGGHYRIDRESLRPFLAREIKKTGGEEEHANAAGKFIHCWEFYSQSGQPQEPCKNCIVYKAKIERCFVIAKSGMKILHSGLYCTDECRSCSYYRLVNKSRFRLLVITSDEPLSNWLESKKTIQFDVRFARCGYGASNVIAQFQPDVIAVDEKLCCDNLPQLVDLMRKDLRNRHTLFCWATRNQSDVKAQTASKMRFVNHERLFEDLLYLLDQ